MSDQGHTAPPCANTTGWFCGAYFTPYNTMELIVTALSIGACVYILIVTMMMQTHDLFKQFTVHLYVPFVPYYVVRSMKLLCKYTSYFGRPVLSLNPNSWLSMAAVYVGCVNQIQYQTLISAIMTVLILGILSPMTFRKFMTGRNLVREFAACHVLVHAVAVVSTFYYVAMRDLNASPLTYLLVEIAFYIMNGAFVVTGLATIATFLTALLVVIAYRRKHGSTPGKNSVGSATQLLTLLIYSIPPTISSFLNSVISLDIIAHELLPATTIVVVSEIYSIGAQIERFCLLMRVIILTITTIVSFNQYRSMTIKLLTCGTIKKRTIVQTLIVSTRTVPPQMTSHR